MWKRLLLIAGAVLLSAVAGCRSGASPKTVLIGADDRALRAVGLRVGEILRVELKENPTTGYLWELSGAKETVCRVISNRFVPPESTLAGAPGLRVAEFQAVAPGVCTLHFGYNRPWEKRRLPVKTRDITVKVME